MGDIIKFGCFAPALTPANAGAVAKKKGDPN